MNFYSSFTKPRKPLAPFSAKRLRRSAELDESRNVVRRRAHGRCEARLDGCRGWGLHAHHVSPRSHGVDHSPENLLWVCGPCHAHIHDHPEESYDLGLLVHSWDQVPPAGAGVSALVPDNQNLPGGCPVSAGES